LEGLQEELATSQETLSLLSKEKEDLQAMQMRLVEELHVSSSSSSSSSSSG